ncbi:MAG: hypothetical protein ABR614_10805 [Mycobacteriales bacterium]
MRRTCAVTAGTLCLLSALSGVASADAPTKAGWWNAVSANGFALPQPTTGADDLHVGEGPSGPSAYAAVAYDLTGQSVSGARLELTVEPDSAVGTVKVQACPTKTITWKAGGNQPYDTRPEYDCARATPGSLAADGSKVVFLLDAPAEASAGYSLAIVPVDGAAPFMVDFAKPGPTSLTPELASAQDGEPTTDTAAPPPYVPPATGTSGTPPLSPTVTVEAPPLTASGPTPELAVPAAPAPVTAAEVPAAAPQVPAAAVRPAVPVSNRERYVAESLLALLVGAFVYALQQPSAQPRLIGGMARKGGAAPLPVLPGSQAPRGIGRFATVRTAPARRLV